ncbi:MAG TPA: hypothetical protein VJ777_13495 [Mycobacterium sp.]|nr:hypothetical protein [Mycobacterium sp.]
MTASTYALLTDPSDPRHGTVNSYRNHGCRCQACTAANAADQMVRRDQRQSRRVPEAVHGTENGYSNYRCRCQLCRDAHAEYARQLRARGAR